MVPLAMLLIALTPNAKAEAKSLLNEGNEHFTNARFEQALKKYEAAHARFPSPKILLNMAEAQRALHRPAEAINLYERALEDELPAEVAPKAEARIEELDPQVGRLVIRCDVEGAQVRIDNRPVGTAPTRAVAVTPGFHEIEVQAPGYQLFEATIKALADTKVELPAKLKLVSLSSSGPTGSPSVVAQRPKSPKLITRWWFWAGIAAVVVVGVGLGVGLSTRSDESAFTGELERTRTDQWMSF